MKRVCITGASGFVGANLARRMLCDGHQVHLLLRKSRRMWRLDGIEQDVQVHEVDAADRAGVRAAVTTVRPDWVFHLAAYGAYSSQTDIASMIATNVGGAANLLDAGVEAGIEAYVQTGSSSEYGYKDHAAHEDELIEPNSSYAVTKAAATHYCQLVSRQKNVHAVTARLYSIYGPYEEPTRLIPTLIAQGLQGKLPPLVSPATARDFVYVDDAVDALIAIAEQAGLPRGSVYNVCSGVQSTLEAVVADARRIMNIRVEPVWATMGARAWDTDVWVGCPDRIAREVGWRARTSFSDGLARTIPSLMPDVP